MKVIDFTENCFFHYFDETKEIELWENIRTDKDLDDKNFIYKKLFNSYEEKLCQGENLFIKRKINEEAYAHTGMKTTHYTSSQFEVFSENFIGGVNYRYNDELGVFNPPTYIYKIPLEKFTKVTFYCNEFAYVSSKGKNVSPDFIYPFKITMGNQIETVFHDYYFDSNEILVLLEFLKNKMKHCKYHLEISKYFLFFNSRKKISFDELEKNINLYLDLETIVNQKSL